MYGMPANVPQHTRQTVLCVLCSFASLPQDATVLSALLQQNPLLSTLDLSGNACLPDRLMHAAALAASCSSLETLDLSGCQLLAPGAYVPDWCPGLIQLDVSDTATTDADVRAVAAGLPSLRHLALAGCRRVSAHTQSAKSSCVPVGVDIACYVQ